MKKLPLVLFLIVVAALLGGFALVAFSPVTVPQSDITKDISRQTPKAS